MTLKDEIDAFLGGVSPADEILKPRVLEAIRWAIALYQAVACGDYDRAEAIRAEAGDGVLLWGSFLLYSSELRRSGMASGDLPSYLSLLAASLGGM